MNVVKLNPKRNEKQHCFRCLNHGEEPRTEAQANAALKEGANQTNKGYDPYNSLDR